LSHIQAGGVRFVIAEASTSAQIAAPCPKAEAPRAARVEVSEAAVIKEVEAHQRVEEAMQSRGC